MPVGKEGCPAECPLGQQVRATAGGKSHVRDWWLNS